MYRPGPVGVRGSLTVSVPAGPWRGQRRSDRSAVLPGGAAVRGGRAVWAVCSGRTADPGSAASRADTADPVMAADTAPSAPDAAVAAACRFNLACSLCRRLTFPLAVADVVCAVANLFLDLRFCFAHASDAEWLWFL